MQYNWKFTAIITRTNIKRHNNRTIEQIETILINCCAGFIVAVYFRMNTQSQLFIVQQLSIRNNNLTDFVTMSENWFLFSFTFGVNVHIYVCVVWVVRAQCVHFTFNISPAVEIEIQSRNWIYTIHFHSHKLKNEKTQFSRLRSVYF